MVDLNPKSQQDSELTQFGKLTPLPSFRSRRDSLREPGLLSHAPPDPLGDPSHKRPALDSVRGNSFSHGKAPLLPSRQSSFRESGMLSQALLPGDPSRRSSAALGSVRGIPGRSHHRKYRSRAGSVTDSTAMEGSQLEPGETASFFHSASRRPSEIPELEEDGDLLAETARLKNYRLGPWLGRQRKALVANIHTTKQRLWGSLVAGVKSLRWEPKTAILASKVGFTCCLASLLIVVEPLRAYFSGFGVWAVITIALVYESNIGTSFSKGFNRIMGTIIAGGLALAVKRTGPLLGPFEPYFVLLSIFATTWIPVYLRFSSPLKDQWNYACSMATITAHLLILGGYKQEGEAIIMPLARFLTIVGGFIFAAVVNLAVKPNFAGDNLHNLVSKNFKTAADVVEKCVEEYVKGTELEPVPEILAGKKIEDQLHSLYHGIVMSESDVDKMMGVISWEPRHGKFTGRYPWALYGDITDNLRYTVYAIIALDSCLRAEIQAPKILRDIFAQEISSVGKEIGNVLRFLHRSLKDMRKFSLHDALQQAEIAALRLQMRLYDNAHRLLMETNNLPGGEELADGLTKETPGEQDREEESTSHVEIPGLVEGASGRGSPKKGPGAKLPTWGVADPPILQEGGSLERSVDDLPGYPDWKQSAAKDCQAENPEEVSDCDSDRSDTNNDEDPESMRLLERGEGVAAQLPGRFLEAAKEGPGNVTEGHKTGGFEWHVPHRESLLGTHYDGTLERVCAMSLVKFASTLIECVAGLRFLVESVDALAERAGFEDPENDNKEGAENSGFWSG